MHILSEICFHILHTLSKISRLTYFLYSLPVKEFLRYHKCEAYFIANNCLILRERASIIHPRNIPIPINRALSNIDASEKNM